MLRFNAPVIALGVALLIVGCNSSSRLPKVINHAYGKVELGMQMDAATALVKGEGEDRAYDNLPANPKPREIYSNLPTNAEWRIWAAPGKPTLVLGSFDGKVVFKQVLWNDDGEVKSDTRALPEYQ